MLRSFERKTVRRILTILLLVACITALHYRTDHLNISSHILFRELYFLPIILAGFWFGARGGLGASISSTLLYLPFVLSRPEAVSGHNFGNITQIILFNIFGLMFGLLRDREKRQQKKLLEVESLAAMGKAVSCIAHDLKTPLMAIGGFVRQVRRKVEDDKLAKKLDVAFEQVQRLEFLVADMLAFARPLNLHSSQGEINNLIKDVVMVSEENASQLCITIKTELFDEMPRVEYDQHRLQQALLNLINNAIEASPSGGEVTIRSQCKQDCIIIEIVDRGGGIPKEQQDSIYTPFVTGKKEGTGLGLPIAKKIIAAHKGSINLLENSDRGTTFQITIPMKQESSR